MPSTKLKTDISSTSNIGRSSFQDVTIYDKDTSQYSNTVPAKDINESLTDDMHSFKVNIPLEKENSIRDKLRDLFDNED